MAWEFIENRRCRLLDEIERLLRDATEFRFAVAFVRKSGVDLITHAVKRAIDRGTTVRFLFGVDLKLTEGAAVRALTDVGAKAKYYAGSGTFHPKGYVFQRASETTAIIGSANLSASGLTSGVEWSVLFNSDEARSIVQEFDRLWQSGDARSVTEDVLKQLKGRPTLSDLRDLTSKEDRSTTPQSVPSISFQWRVKPSFGDYAVHPITVPKKQVTHEELRSRRFDRGEFTVIYGNSARLRGYMHSANEGSRRYYQIRMNGPAEHPLFALPVGRRLLVRLEGSPGSARAILTPASGPRDYN